MSQLTDIQIKIHSIIEEYESVRKAKDHLAIVEDELAQAYDKIKSMDAQLDKELKDIDALDKIGVKALFYKTLGSKEEQMEKERQEYLELSLKYKEYKAEVELMEFERDLLVKKSNKIVELQQSLIRLKKARKSEILTGSDLQRKDDLMELMEKLDLHIALKKELSEAVQAGKDAIRALDVVIGHLDEAGHWGKWDMMGDHRAKYSKRQAIDLAVRRIPEARNRMQIFTRELADLGDTDTNINVNQIRANKFTDFFFDNLISDWIVQQRIVGTRNDVQNSKSHVQRVLMSLTREQSQVLEKLELLKNQYNSLLTD